MSSIVEATNDGKTAAIREGDIRRHLLGLAQISFTGCFKIDGPVNGSICFHEGAVWHAQRLDQIHLLTWLRTVGALHHTSQEDWDARNPGATLREAVSKDPTLDMATIEARVFDYVASEINALLEVGSGTAALVPGDVTDARFVSAWPVKHILNVLAERSSLPASEIFGPTNPYERQAAQADLFELGVIVES